MVVGGERWWQIRGLDGVDAEWITQKEFLSDKDVDKEGKLSTEDANILRMEHLETVLVSTRFIEYLCIPSDMLPSAAAVRAWR